MASPPRPADDFVRIVAAGGPVLREIIGFFEPEDRIPLQYRRVADLGDRVSLRVGAAEEMAGRHHGTFRLEIAHGDPPSFAVILPAHLGSVEAAGRVAALQPEVDPRVSLALDRLRQTVCMVIDLVWVGYTGMLATLKADLGAVPRGTAFHVSYEDATPDPDVFTLSRRRGVTNPLMPDPAFFNSEGYRDHKRRVLLSRRRFAERGDLVVWRGATTGPPVVASDPLQNQRIALAALCAAHPDLFDVKITTLVQVPARDLDAVRGFLEARGLLAAWAPFDDMAGHKFAIHVDGNASASGLLEKMCLGCCVLRVESGFEAWIEPDIRPWEHYVPVLGDLSDLVDKVRFLRGDVGLAERIAGAGFAFAMAADYRAEADRLVARVCAAARPARPRVVLFAPRTPDGEAAPGWHEREVMPDGAEFRWTGAERVAFDGHAVPAGADLARVEVPFAGEIVANYAARCTIAVGGRAFPVSVVGAALVAEVALGAGEAGGPIALLAPPPVQPSAVHGSGDTRRLGLAVPIAPLKAG